MLLVCDYHKILSSNDFIREENIKRLADWMNYGNMFLITFDCPTKEAEAILKDNNIPIDFYSTQNGAHLFDRNGNLLFEENIPSGLLKKIEEIAHNSVVNEILFDTTRNMNKESPLNKKVSCIYLGVNKDQNCDAFYKYLFELKKEYDYELSFLPKEDMIYYIIKPKGVTRIKNVRFLEYYLPILKKFIVIDADKEDEADDILDFNGYYIGNNNDDNNTFPSYDEFYLLVKNLPKKKVKNRLKCNL